MEDTKTVYADMSIREFVEGVLEFELSNFDIALLEIFEELKSANKPVSFIPPPMFGRGLSEPYHVGISPQFTHGTGMLKDDNLCPTITCDNVEKRFATGGFVTDTSVINTIAIGSKNLLAEELMKKERSVADVYHR